MRRGSTIAVMVLAVFCTLPVFGQRAALFDELTPLYPDGDPKAGVVRFELDTPRGVPAAVHVLVAGLPAEASVRWRLTLDGQAVVDARAYRLIDVPVEQNTGLVSRTEVWDGKDNPHVIREAPFRVYEALEPAHGELHASDASVLAVDPTHDLWRIPYDIVMGGAGALATVYGGTGSDGVAVNLDQIPPDVEVLAQRPSETSFYWLAREESRFLLWGFNDGPSVMTTEGKELFVNTAYYAFP